MDLVKKLPIEFYVLLLPSIIILFVFYITNSLDISFDLKANIFFGSMTGKTLFLLLAIMLAGLIGYHTMKINILDKQKRDESIDQIFSGLISCFFLSLAIVLATITMGVLVKYLFAHSDTAKVINLSHQIMNLDFQIFRIYPSIAIQALGKYHALEVMMIHSYLQLATFAPIFLLISVINKNAFRKYSLSFFISLAIAWPIWYISPVIQPGPMYRLNILKTQIPSAIELSMSQYTPTIYNKIFMAKIDKFWIDPMGKTLSVSNNPSMHVAWGLLLMWYSIMLWPYLGLITIPWCILNVLGTMYTMQHYGVDVLSGIILALITIFIVEKLFQFERRYLNDEYKLLSFFDLIKDIGERIIPNNS